jgi:hypothetical protein
MSERPKSAAELGDEGLHAERDARVEKWCNDIPELRDTIELLRTEGLPQKVFDRLIDAFNRKYFQGSFAQGSGKYDTAHYFLNNQRSFRIKKGEGSNVLLSSTPEQPNASSSDSATADPPYPTSTLDGAYSPQDARRLAVDGAFLGVDAEQVSLTSLAAIGVGRVEAYFETSQGNLYALMPSTSRDGLVLYDGRRNLAKGKDTRGSKIPAIGELRLGEPLYYRPHGKTSRVTRIVLVDTRNRTPDVLVKASKGSKSDIRSQFRRLVGL